MSLPGYITRLLEGRTTLAQHRELLVLAGWLAALLACARYDAGDRAAARTAARLARRYAQQAGHGEITAWTFEIAAWFALVEGRYPATTALAEAGMEHAGNTSVGVQLALQAARGYARMGDSRTWTRRSRSPPPPWPIAAAAPNCCPAPPGLPEI